MIRRVIALLICGGVKTKNARLIRSVRNKAVKRFSAVQSYPTGGAIHPFFCLLFAGGTVIIVMYFLFDEKGSFRYAMNRFGGMFKNVFKEKRCTVRRY